MLKPKAKFKKITDIPMDLFINNNIKGIILDLDNTLIDLDRKPINDLDVWISKVKNSNIKLCIASNTIRKSKVSDVAEKLQIPYVCFSKKPLKYGLKKAKNILDIDYIEIAEIGDQLFTDVIGANRLKMFSILTDPIGEEKFYVAKLKRKFERFILNKQKRGEK